jgi:hypothetical protein
MENDTDKARRDACLLRKAIRELLAEHPDGLAPAEIFNLLLSHNKFMGTRRNLEVQTNAILQALIDENKIERGNEAGTAVLKPRK